jgi:hypothetical protein
VPNYQPIIYAVHSFVNPSATGFIHIVGNSGNINASDRANMIGRINTAEISYDLVLLSAAASQPASSHPEVGLSRCQVARRLHKLDQAGYISEQCPEENLFNILLDHAPSPILAKGCNRRIAAHRKMPRNLTVTV